MGLVSLATARMWVRTEERVTPARIRNMRVELGRPQVGVAQHLLHRAQVGAPFEQVGGEGMAQQMGVDARRIEARLGGQAAQDEKRAGPCERAALRVEEELRPVPPVQERPAAGKVSAHGLDALAPERHDALLVSLAEAANNPVVEVDPAAVEAHGLAHPEPGSVEELDERAVSERARGRSVRGLDEPLDFPGGEGAGQARASAREIEVCGRVVLAPAEEDEVVVEGARSGRAI